MDNTDIGKPVINYSKTNIESVNYNDTIYNVVEKLLRTGFRRFPVLQIRRFPIRTYKVCGIITAMDILDAFLRDVSFNSHISTIMSRDVVTCKYYEPLEVVVKRFKFSRRGGFPVVDDKANLKGLITEHDIVCLFENSISEIHVKDIMTKNPFYIKPTSFYDCLNTIANTKYRKLPIVEDKKIHGLMTDRLCLDTIKKHKYYKNELNFPVDQIMQKKIFTIDQDSDLKEAVEMMKHSRLGGLIVEEKGMLRGIITERDILERAV